VRLAPPVGGRARVEHTQAVQTSPACRIRSTPARCPATAGGQAFQRPGACVSASTAMRIPQAWHSQARSAVLRRWREGDQVAGATRVASWPTERSRNASTISMIPYTSSQNPSTIASVASEIPG
jgi:hypothetical protein